MPTNVQITSARYFNEQNTVVFVLLSTGDTWFVRPGDGSGQANILASWVSSGNNIGPFVPVVPGAAVPVGSILWSASGKVPMSYLFCDGQALSRKQFANLFQVIGTVFGAGDGLTTFNIPDLRGRFIRGWGPADPLDPNRTLGSYQGSQLGRHSHTITDAGHTHDVTDLGHVHGVNDPGHVHGVSDPTHSHGVSDPGHNHVRLFLNANYIGVKAPTSNLFLVPDDIDPYFRGYYGLKTQPTSAGLVPAEASSNLSVNFADANVSDLVNTTGVTVASAGTNITQTEPEGGLVMRPYNLSLLPYIRF